MSISIVLVDDNDELRAGISQWLSRTSDMAVIGEATNGRDGIACVLRMQPDIVIMDVNMPIMDGIQATQQIVAHSSCKVLICTSGDIGSIDASANRAGAHAVFRKEDIGPVMLDAIRALAKKG